MVKLHEWPGIRKKQFQMRNAIVVYVDCRGCMSTDHRFDWIGRVYDFSSHPELGPIAHIKVIARQHEGSDIRDKRMGEETVVVRDTCVQRIDKGLFFVFK